MITKEENDRLTLTGADTPGGEFMRRYWQPIALASELPEPGSIVPVRLLGEDLALFRDGQGALGLLWRWCSHRRTDLTQGWAEDEGLRCPLHGWIFDRQGNCLDQPMEPPDQKFCEEIHHPAFPVVERGGLIFGYLGPGEAPVFPEYEFMAVPDESRAMTKYWQECNYLQALEGNVDPSQMALLSELVRDGGAPGPQTQTQLQLDAEETGFGVRLVSVVGTEASERDLAVRNFVMPSLCLVPAFGFDGGVAHWHVPVDDTHHWRFVIAFRRNGAISEEEARRNGVQETEQYRVATSREEMATSYIAWATMLAESQGPIHDRTRESLGDSDEGILAVRSVIWGGIQNVAEGADPLHVLRDPEEANLGEIAPAQRKVAPNDDWHAVVDGVLNRP